MSKLALLGGGRMGEALLAGLLASGCRHRDEIVVKRSQELAGGEPEA